MILLRSFLYILLNGAKIFKMNGFILAENIFILCVVPEKNYDGSVRLFCICTTSFVICIYYS